VERIYDDSYFTGGGAGYSDYIRHARLIRAHGRRYGRLLNSFMSPGTILDVGAAAGFVLQGFGDEGWTGDGIEPNSSMLRYARDQEGLSVSYGILEQFSSSKKYDVVSLIQVLGHFVDPVAALRRAAEATKPGGYWLIETWDRESWTARIFGRRWHEYSPPSVLHWFTPASVKRLSQRFGFEEIARGRPTKRLNGGHLKSLLKFKSGDRSSKGIAAHLLSLIPDDILIPYHSEDLFWMLLRQQSSDRLSRD
jgi:SAM-dependent methyltransferase